VKAREIYRRAHAIADPPRKWVLDTIDPSNPTLHTPVPLRIPKKEEHVVAARNLISTLTYQSGKFRNSLTKFSTELSPRLHTELQALDDLVDNTLTPRVRVAADQAGELSMRLTTSSTLTVKALHDVIDGAIRRRRKGPVRYFRRLGYQIIEWGVVGLLWGIWLVVTVLRVIWGSLKAVYTVIRWMLFL